MKALHVVIVSLVICIMGVIVSYTNEHWNMFAICAFGCGWFMCPLVLSLDTHEERSQEE